VAAPLVVDGHAWQYRIAVRTGTVYTSLDPDGLIQAGGRREWLWTRERGVSLRSLALQFGLRNPPVGTVLAGADSPAQVDEIVEAASVVIPDAIWTEVAERIARQQG